MCDDEQHEQPAHMATVVLHFILEALSAKVRVFGVCGRTTQTTRTQDYSCTALYFRSTFRQGAGGKVRLPQLGGNQRLQLPMITNF